LWHLDHKVLEYDTSSIKGCCFQGCALKLNQEKKPFKSVRYSSTVVFVSRILLCVPFSTFILTSHFRIGNPFS
ncbi:hypothetical protein BD408DRAFT_14172, partial [Parasitella parasitica]